MINKADVYPEEYFGGFSAVDGTIAFYTRVHALLNPRSVVLDFGCGRGEYNSDPILFRRDLRRLRGRVAHLIGADVDEQARGNPFIDEFVQLSEDGRLPLESGTLDLLLADWVLEHVRDFPLFFSEAQRVIKPGGKLCIRTLNRWSYVGIASRTIPNRLHSRILGVAQPGREERDVFPTFYLCNTIRALRRMLSAAQFKCVVFGHEAEPSYLRSLPFLYGVGAVIHRFIPSSLASSLFAFGERLGPTVERIGSATHAE
jgi:SAM-dependent methyltransferase